MGRVIPLSRPSVGSLEREAVERVLVSGRLALGPYAAEFEKLVARFVGCRHSVAVSSGTAGLHLVVRALRIGAGDEVVTTPFSFVASSNCLLFERARPVFVDVEPDTMNIDPEMVEAAIGRRTRAILAVDVFGHPADWARLGAIASRHGLSLVEDSCEALGSAFGDRMCGSFGDAAVYAFYPNKQVTTGEGGMVVTNSQRIASLCRSMANQGRRPERGTSSRPSVRIGPSPEARLGRNEERGAGAWLEHVRLGYNYRMSELSAAVGVAQMRRVRRLLGLRKRVARWYEERLRELPGVLVPQARPGTEPAWFAYVVRLEDGSSRPAASRRHRLLEGLRARGIECSDYFRPIHLQPFYAREFGYRRGDFPVAESTASRTVALPFYAEMSEAAVDFVCRQLRRLL